MRGCGDQPQRCVICAGPHKVEDHQCGVARCKKGKRRICVHITPKCANCSGTHAANSPRCTSRHQADMIARKEKKTKEKEEEKGRQKLEVAIPTHKQKWTTSMQNKIQPMIKLVPAKPIIKLEPTAKEPVQAQITPARI